MRRSICLFLLGTTFFANRQIRADPITPETKNVIVASIGPTFDLMMPPVVFTLANSYSFQINGSVTANGWQASIAGAYGSVPINIAYSGLYSPVTDTVNWTGAGSYGVTPWNISGTASFTSDNTILWNQSSRITPGGMQGGIRVASDGNGGTGADLHGALDLTFSGGKARVGIRGQEGEIHIPPAPPAPITVVDDGVYDPVPPPSPPPQPPPPPPTEDFFCLWCIFGVPPGAGKTATGGSVIQFVEPLNLGVFAGDITVTDPVGIDPICIPEPSTFALFSTSVLGLLGYWWLRKK